MNAINLFLRALCRTILLARVFGGVREERLQLNEGTLRAGGPYDPASPDALGALPEVRRLIFESRYKQADRLIAVVASGILA
jgi:alpha-L-fucosidase 2